MVNSGDCLQADGIIIQENTSQKKKIFINKNLINYLKVLKVDESSITGES